MPRTGKRHTYTSEEKARWAFGVIRGERSLAQVSSESGVHANVLRQWRDTFLAQGSAVFASGRPLSASAPLERTVYVSQ